MFISAMIVKENELISRQLSIFTNETFFFLINSVGPYTDSSVMTIGKLMIALHMHFTSLVSNNDQIRRSLRDSNSHTVSEL